MDTNQTRIVELLREVHLIAYKEIERLNLRIADLESQIRQPAQPPANPVIVERPATNPPAPNQSEPGLWNERQVAKYLKICLGSVRRWRTLRMGPMFVKIGAAVRYRHQDVKLLRSCISFFHSFIVFVNSCPVSPRRLARLPLPL